MNGISIVVCCYNSASKLLLTLPHLSKQVTDGKLNWEVIIVDNNSTDDTTAVALATWQASGCNKPLRTVFEAKPGLCYARETGVAKAAFDIIIFCDDDNLLAENYVQHSYQLVMDTKVAGYAIWGGRSIAYFDKGTKIPEWFEHEKSNYVIGEQGDKTGDISYRGYVWGAGMIILKQVYLQLINQQFPLLLVGRKGDILLAGDDSELCMRSLIAGYKLFYDERLFFEHYVPQSKLTADYNNGLRKGFSLSNQILNKYKIFIYYISGSNFIRRLYYTGAYSIKNLLHRTGLRKLTTHDEIVLHALFVNGKFKDDDFDLMRSILKLRTKNY